MTKQRSTRPERKAALEVLKTLWEKAYHDGEVIMDFPPEKDGIHKAKILHQALGDYRKKVRRSSLQQFDLYVMINAVMLVRPSDHTVMLKRKAEAYSDRTRTILEAASMVDGLTSEKNHEHSLAGVLDSFTSK